MLWTIIAILSGVCLQLFALVGALRSRWARARWMASVTIVWALNCGFGAFIFATAKVENYWYWKPTLGTSAMMFTALLGAALYFQRKTADEEKRAKPERSESVAILLGLAAVPIGWGTIFFTWL